MHSTGTAAMMGSAGLTAPLWLKYADPIVQIIDPLFQFLAAAVGFFILVLTAWNKLLEVKIKRAALQDAQEAEHGETLEK